MIRAAAVAWPGTTPTIGEKNIAARKRTPTTIATQPVRPPWATPAPDSM